MGEAGALPSMDRRKAIKVGAATVGAAYVAPQVLKLGKAGASNHQTCWAIKFDDGGCVTPKDITSGDSACGSLDVAAQLAGEQVGTLATAPTVTFSPPGGCSDGQTTTVTVGSNCIIKWAGYAAGPNCTDSAGITGVGTNEVTITSQLQNPGGNIADISHINLVVCCTDGS